MGNINLASDQPYVAGLKSVKSERDDQNTLQPLEVTSRRTSLPKIALSESQTCAKRLMLGRPVPASLTAPVNFSMVSEGLYRSGYPQAQDYPFMQNLKLKTIVTLVKKELPDGYQEFIEVNGITHKIFDSKYFSVFSSSCFGSLESSQFFSGQNHALGAHYSCQTFIHQTQNRDN
ncbi:hypothetical protein F5B21DRAFT_166622 [Xylaria acuta]|nr:hypothetical protein F5B21DRAFT_166622 [Xylaria acuta]